VQGVVAPEPPPAVEQPAALHRRRVRVDLLAVPGHQHGAETGGQHGHRPLPGQRFLLVQAHGVRAGDLLGHLLGDHADHRDGGPCGDAFVDFAFALEVGHPLEQRDHGDRPVLGGGQRGPLDRVRDGDQRALAQPGVRGL
jgi:hypothetical protein